MNCNGALAQLGVRYAGSVEVAGSSPVCSIKKSRLNKSGFFIFQNQLTNFETALWP